MSVRHSSVEKCRSVREISGCFESVNIIPASHKTTFEKDKLTQFACDVCGCTRDTQVMINVPAILYLLTLVDAFKCVAKCECERD